MPKLLVLVPFALDDAGLANRGAQSATLGLGPDVTFDYRGVAAGPTTYDSHHDWLLADIGMFEAGMDAADEGYDGVCIDTLSDSGVNALRSVLDIPVVGAGSPSYLTALLLGNRFSILTQWDPWVAIYERSLREYELADKCASIRSINMPPDVRNLLGGKEEVVFPRLVEEGMRCVEDGADVVILGSTTMHEAHSHLAEALPVPVLNPGPLSYRIVLALIGAGLSQSRRAYRGADAPKREMVRAMLAAGAAAEADRGSV